MGTFTIGFLSGFFANWVFGMLTRLLPATLVRYQVRAVALQSKGEPGERPNYWELDVRLTEPRWARILMEPLRESLVVELRVDKRAWQTGKWDEGDINTFRLLASSVLTASILVFTFDGYSIYLGDSYPGLAAIADEHIHTISVRVIRSVDNSLATETHITVKRTGDNVIAKML